MVVFFDIDGTVMDYETQIIPESAAEAIRLLKKNGHIPVVNTGRPLGHVDPRIRELDFSGWICSCGMELLLDGELIYTDYPTPAECKEILQISNDCCMALQTEGQDSLLYNANMPYPQQGIREATRLKEQGLRVEPFRIDENPTFVKFVTYDTPTCRREEFLERISPYFDPIIRLNTLIEYVKKGHSKAEGMERFLKILNLTTEETFAVGDSENDLPMFAIAGTTICMGDGLDSVKQQADYVTDPVMQDGLFNAMRHFGLI